MIPRLTGRTCRFTIVFRPNDRVVNSIGDDSPVLIVTLQIRDIVQAGYNRLLRPRLPHKISVLNGVAVSDEVKLLDQTEVFPEYEEAIISSLRRLVEYGDVVTIVGGGKGVSTVVAARHVGRGGQVVTFEGSGRQVTQVRNTVSLNKVTDRVEISPAIVSEFNEYSESEYGSAEATDTIPPESLPDCDVLELDCEGAEVDILERMEIEPEVIIVETHTFLDAPTEEVADLLRDRRYEIVQRGVEDEAKGVHVLTGVLEDSDRTLVE